MQGVTSDLAEDLLEDSVEDKKEPDKESSSQAAAPSLTKLEQQYGTITKAPKRIHILGTGSIGKLVAHSLRSLPDPPPVTLIFHRAKLWEAWQDSKQEITIHRDGHDIKQTGFDVELALEHRVQHGVVVKPKDEHLFQNERQPHLIADIYKRHGSSFDTYTPELRPGSKLTEPLAGDHIQHLIVTTKTNMTVAALLPIKHRIRSSSTICLLQNGMGVIDELNEKLFTNPAHRPKYIQGIITHGVNVPLETAVRDPFYAVHAGQGTIALGLMTRPEDSVVPENARYLLRMLTRSPVLVAVTHTPTELLQLQLEKLAVNCILNPLTALLDARNGSILYNFAITRTMRLMLAEISLVIRSLPELRGLPNAASRFSTARLETVVVTVAGNTAKNISSMLADIRAGRATEIEYINGYIIRRGEELGIKCVVNYGIMNTVIGKSKITQMEANDVIPIEGKVDLNQGL